VASNGNSPETPPSSEELEISIFGPGFGECIVLHFGNGDWAIVDSCLDPETKRPAALQYLESIKVNVAKSVLFIAATHWHDDHIQGLNLVFKCAESAVFACSGAVRHPDFNGILSSWTGTQYLPGGSGLDELRAIMVELKKRNSDTRFPTPVLATSNKTLWERKTEPISSIKALSPSDASVLAATAKLKAINPQSAKIRRRIPDVTPNDASVVLAVHVGRHRVLLGADLEVQADASLGWKAIVNNFDASNEKHHGFKISHHGSSNGHHEAVWNQMLINNPWAVTTPFVRGKLKLPSKDDCQRVLGYTTNAFLTAPPQPRKFRDSDRAVEKMVNETAILAHFIPGRYGHVRLRKRVADSPDSPWNVDLFGHATKVEDYLQSVR